MNTSPNQKYKLIIYVHNSLEINIETRFIWLHSKPDTKYLDEKLAQFLSSRDFLNKPLTLNERQIKYKLFNGSQEMEKRMRFYVSIFAIFHLHKHTKLEELYFEVLSNWSATNIFAYYEKFFQIPLLTVDHEFVHPIDLLQIASSDFCATTKKSVIYFENQDENQRIALKQLFLDDIVNDITLIKHMIIEDPRLCEEALLTNEHNAFNGFVEEHDTNCSNVIVDGNFDVTNETEIDHDYAQAQAYEIDDYEGDFTRLKSDVTTDHNAQNRENSFNVDNHESFEDTMETEIEEDSMLTSEMVGKANGVQIGDFRMINHNTVHRINNLENVIVDGEFIMSFEDTIQTKIESDSKQTIDQKVQVDENLIIKFEDSKQPKMEIDDEKKDLKPLIDLQNKIDELKSQIVSLKAENEKLKKNQRCSCGSMIGTVQKICSRDKSSKNEDRFYLIHRN